MDITALLCNHAEAQNGLLYISGAGVEMTQVPPGAPGPIVTSLGIAVQVGVPWVDTNRQHTLRVDLVDADGGPVEVPGPQGPMPFLIEVPFTVGRSPMAAEGSDQFLRMALNMPGLPLPSAGEYVFRVSVDGKATRQLPYRVVLPPAISFGPTAIPSA